MIETKFEFSMINEKLVERIIDDENVNINHMILTKDTCIPEHFSNSNVYMIIVRGTMSIGLSEQDFHRYEKGSILNIPYNVKMNVCNHDDEVLEFFVIKSPAPKNYGK